MFQKVLQRGGKVLDLEGSLKGKGPRQVYFTVILIKLNKFNCKQKTNKRLYCMVNYKRVSSLLQKIAISSVFVPTATAIVRYE